MPRSPEGNQQIKDARRTDILRAATRVFAKKGFSDTKISDVAKEAGLSHGLVYHYFENKDAVFRAILEDKLERSRSLMVEDDALGGTALDRMRASLALWFDRVRAEPDMSHVITQAIVSDNLDAETREMVRAHMRESFESATQRLARGQEAGEIGKHASARELATFLHCFMRGLAFATIVDYGFPLELPSPDLLARVLVPAPALDELTAAASASASAAADSAPRPLPRGPAKDRPVARGALVRAVPKKKTAARKASR